VDNKDIYLCAISNISSGRCVQDCKFCTQSLKYRANIQRYKQKDIKTIIQEAKLAKQNQAHGFCLVTSGKGIDDEKKLDFICRAISAVKKEVDNLLIIACNGIATKEQLSELKKAGADAYNHNLETSKEYYDKICSTHSWQERLQTAYNVKEIGLHLISGGIFGMGESKKDRIMLLKTLKELNPFSVPINFFHPNSALPLKKNTLKDIDEALDMIRLAKQILPKCTRVMVAGGREYMFRDRQGEIFDAGADSIVIGNYLTTTGSEAIKDFELIKNSKRKIAKECNG